jgi:hypothetical protein
MDRHKSWSDDGQKHALQLPMVKIDEQVPVEGCLVIVLPTKKEGGDRVN